MRALQIMMLLLCALAGAQLLLQAPSFIMPARDPSLGIEFNPEASRLLGAGLLILALAGTQYLHAMYYGGSARWRRQISAQRRYFLLLLLAIALLAAALWHGEAGPNPEDRPPVRKASQAEADSSILRPNRQQA